MFSNMNFNKNLHTYYVLINCAIHIALFYGNVQNTKMYSICSH